MTRLVLGSRNAHKVAEIKRFFAPLGVEVEALPADIPEAVEDRETFRGNAAKKAEEYARATGALVLADDSGLEVDALDGAPGVISARYAGEPKSDARNNEKLLAELADVAEEARGARFVCVMALADPQGLRLVVEGALPGRILPALRGDGGFGYDPLFLLPEDGRSLAELGPDEKNAISHRGRALERVRVALPAILGEA